MKYRRLYLSDTISLVIAAAIGFAWAQAQTPLSLELRLLFSRPIDYSHLIGTLLVIFHPIFSMLTIILFMLWLRRPCPKLLHLARQPGFLACAVATLGVAIGLLLTCIIHIMTGLDISDIEIIEIWRYITFGIGWAVLGAWVGLIVGSRWRPEPSWLDRLGRTLGIIWIVFPIAILSGILFSE